MSTLLFSIDLEDVRDWVKDGNQHTERVPANTEKYLRFLQDKKLKATFFVVGQVAKKYPSLIKMISEEGHEIACHSDSHIQLDKLSPQLFKEDLLRNIDNLNKAGANDIKGFRAPTFSMTEKTTWAYDVLEELKFTYSSSVLAAKNPLYGWKEFGMEFKKINKTIWELPISLHNLPFLKVPLAGGVYFRVLPFFLTKYSAHKKFREGKPVLTYFHPYDIDTGQERFMHPDLNNNYFLNKLMYINRSKVLRRLEYFSDTCKFVTYSDYVKNNLH